jgi:hypothetical protein
VSSCAFIVSGMPRKLVSTIPSQLPSLLSGTKNGLYKQARRNDGHAVITILLEVLVSRHDKIGSRMRGRKFDKGANVASLMTGTISPRKTALMI